VVSLGDGVPAAPIEDIFFHAMDRADVTAAVERLAQGTASCAW
jgi:hypothetical protein